MKYFIFFPLFAATYAAPIENGRTVESYECRKNSVPYQVSVAGGYHFCGGALISRTWVLSAALCRSAGSIQVLLGEHDIDVNEGTEQSIDAVKFIIHPYYNRYNEDNNIMLIKLSQPVTLNNYIRTVSLPSSCAVAGTRCLISGWGSTYDSEDTTHDLLRCQDAPILSDRSCRSSYPGQITSNMFCAGSLEGDQGYSGSPIVCNGQLQGVVCWLGGIVGSNDPGVYTKVCNYNSWIRNIMISE
uniref:trypsin n=1 Tax=Stegastes partitus TaxID=144197 RepID=A0A3B5B1W0_9TELE